MATKWRMQRLSIQTINRIAAIRESLLKGHDTGKRVLSFDDQGRVSTDQVIAILCDLYEDHRARSRKSKRRGVDA